MPIRQLAQLDCLFEDKVPRSIREIPYCKEGHGWLGERTMRMIAGQQSALLEVRRL